MKQRLFIALCLVLSTSSQAASELQLPIVQGTSTDEAHQMLDSGIALLWADQSYATPIKDFGRFTADKRTSVMHSSDTEGCERAFLSALIELQWNAKREGGNAVVRIRSLGQNRQFSLSTTSYSCQPGRVSAHVTLRGEVVKIP